MSTAALPFQEVAGKKLNDEQSAYLHGLFTGLANRGLKFTDIEADPTKSAEPIDEELLGEVQAIFAAVKNIGHAEGLPENN